MQKGLAGSAASQYVGSQQSLGAPNSSQPTIDRFQTRLLTLLEGPGRRLSKELHAQSGVQAQRLAQVIDDFGGFSRSYFAFFATGRAGPASSSDFNRLLLLLQQEVDVLSRAGQQRLLADFADTLEIVDSRAAAIYQRFLGYKADPTALPIIFFEKVFGIRRSLYTRFPLISIPLLAMSEPEQWVGGIAHELGHYIYWNSSTLATFERTRKDLDTAVLQALDIPRDNYERFHEAAEVAGVWHAWTEEVFADICGTMLLGPNYVYAAIRLVEEASGPVTSDDRMHPALYIRPLIGIVALRWLANHLGAAPEAARLHAAVAHLEARWLPEVSRYATTRHEERNITMGEVDAKTALVVETMLGPGAGAWVGSDGTTRAALGDLFDCSAWLAELSEDGLPLRDTPLPILPGPEKASGSAAFEQLRKFVEDAGGTAEEVRQALLLISLAEVQGQICHARYVIRVADGTGKYDAC